MTANSQQPTGNSGLQLGLSVAILVLSFANLAMAAWGLCQQHRIEAMLKTANSQQVTANSLKAVRR